MAIPVEVRNGFPENGESNGDSVGRILVFGQAKKLCPAGTAENGVSFQPTRWDLILPNLSRMNPDIR
ncbi:MAG: hypothetical protein ABSA45_10280 [Verrucomicrobiota bacterium]|jgi:hypothetical protein